MSQIFLKWLLKKNLIFYFILNVFNFTQVLIKFYIKKFYIKKKKILNIFIINYKFQYAKY